MDKNRAKMLHALAESFGFFERPDQSDPVMSRAYERANAGIEALKAGTDDVSHTLQVIVLSCGQIGAFETQAVAAGWASALGVDLRPVLGGSEAAA